MQIGFFNWESYCVYLSLATKDKISQRDKIFTQANCGINSDSVTCGEGAPYASKSFCEENELRDPRSKLSFLLVTFKLLLYHKNIKC